MQGYADSRVYDSARQALDLVRSLRPELVANDPELAAPIDAYITRHGRELGRHWDRWSEAELQEQLRNILARDLVPEVTTYRSPLTVVDAVRVIGLVAGSLAMLLLMLFAPILAGTQMAQEVHENTLQPLTGTALSARDLVLGMTLGPIAVALLADGPAAAPVLRRRRHRRRAPAGDRSRPRLPRR